MMNDFQSSINSELFQEVTEKTDKRCVNYRAPLERMTVEKYIASNALRNLVQNFSHFE